MIMKYKWTLIGTAITLLAVIMMVAVMEPESLVMESQNGLEEQMRFGQLLRVGFMTALFVLCWSQFSWLLATFAKIDADTLLRYRWRIFGWYMLFELVFGLRVMG